MAISCTTVEVSADDEEGKTVLGRFSYESLQLRIYYFKSFIYCEEESQHFQVPLFLPSHLPSSGSPEHWKSFLDCCFGQFVEKKGLQVFPKLSGGGACCSKKPAQISDSAHPISRAALSESLTSFGTRVTNMNNAIMSAKDQLRNIETALGDAAMLPQSLEAEIARLKASLDEKLVALDTARSTLLETEREARKQESSLQERLHFENVRNQELENNLKEAIEANQKRQAFKVKTEEKEVQVDEHAGTDFDALQINSSDLQSRLICACGMFKEAENKGLQLYAEKIMAWIRTNGDPVEILKQTKLTIVHLSMQVTIMRPLAFALQQMQQLRHVVLQHANIDAVATGILCEGLQHATGLLTLDLQYNNIDTAGAIEIGKRKKDWKNLTTLFLNDPQSAHIGPKGVEALFGISAEDRALWEKTYLNSLERVCLGGHQIKDEGVQHLVQAFPYMEQLTTLYLYENGITDRGADLLIENIQFAVNLTYISTRGNAMSSDRELRLQQALQRLASSRQVQPANPIAQEYEPVVLRTLPDQQPGVEQIFIQQDLLNEQAGTDLYALQNNSSDIQSRLICAWAMLKEAQDNGLQSYAEQIWAWMQRHGDPDMRQSKLTIVHLSMPVTIMRPLGFILQQMQQLRHVVLQHANIDAVATGILCEGLQHATGLLTLDLQYNNIGTAGAIEIGKRKKDWKNLTTLFLNDPESAPIGPKGVEALFDISAEDKASAEKTYLNSLERVCLGGHQIKDEGVQHLVQAFPYMEQLTTLYLYENGITDRGADLLIEKIQLALNLTYISTRGNAMSSDRELRLQQALQRLVSSRQVKPANSRPQDYEPVVLRTLPDQPSGVERIFIQPDLPYAFVEDEYAGMSDFYALQNNSSDLQSRLICAWSMFKKAQDNGLQSYAEKIQAWMRRHGDPDMRQSKLTIVHLSMPVTIMRPLGFILQQMQQIRHVVLQHAEIDAVATGILCEGLQHATGLLTLDLQYNNIDTAGAIEIGKRKKEWKNLTTLFLNDPQSAPIGSKGVEALFGISAEDKASAEKTYLNSLERVCLGGHQIKDEGVQHLVQAFPYMKQLTTLYLYENGITDRGADLLIENIQLAVNLTYISTRGNAMGSDKEEQLQQALQRLVSSRQVQPAKPRPQEYKPVVLRTMAEQPPGVERIFIQGDMQKPIAVLGNKVQCFDVATGQWQRLLELRRYIQADVYTSSTFIAPNCIVVCGGGLTTACTRHVGNTAYVLEEDGSVQELPHMSYGRWSPGLAWDSVRQVLYVFGGSSSSSGTCYTVTLRSSEMFQSRWLRLPDMHQARAYFNPCWHSFIVYLCGGIETNTVETYDPRSNAFALQDFNLPETTRTTAVVVKGMLTVISNEYISKLQHGRLTSQQHGQYNPWSNSTPLVIGEVVYVVSLANNCCRCIDLNTGAVQQDARLS